MIEGLGGIIMGYPKEYPKLKFPQQQTLERAQMERWYGSGESFAGTVYAAMRDGEKEANKEIGSFSWRNDSHFYALESLATTVNGAYDLVRSKICDAAEKYLLEHDGIIDVWPDAVGEGVHQLTREDAETEKTYPVGTFIFEYFGDDYVEKLGGLLRRKKENFVYRSGLYTKGSYWTLDRAISEDSPKSKKLKKEMEEAQGKTNSLATLGTLVGIPYFALGALCILACMFFGFGDVITALLASLERMPADSALRTVLNILYIVAFLPGILYGCIAMLEGKLYWILTVLLLLACAGGAVLCFFGYREFHELSVLARQAKKEYRDYMGNEKYKTQMREKREALTKQAEFAEEWQRAWYDWICSVRKAPDTTEELDRKLSEKQKSE